MPKASTLTIVDDVARLNISSTVPSVSNAAHAQVLQRLLAKLPLVGINALTPSQALFSRLTELDVRCLRLAPGPEFFIFMDLRAEYKWASYKMNAFKWVSATEEYNARLTKYGREHPEKLALVIKKNPRALMEKLVEIEQKILNRIARRDFKCKSTSHAHTNVRTH